MDDGDGEQAEQNAEERHTPPPEEGFEELSSDVPASGDPAPARRERAGSGERRPGLETGGSSGDWEGSSIGQ